MTIPINPLEPLLTIEKVAEILALSEKKVRRLIDSGQLPCIRIGRAIRIRPDDLKAYIARQRIG